jgi:hypothetical protein
LATAGVAIFLPGALRAQTLTGATVQTGQNSLTLSPGGNIYIYGMGTGGARSATNFARGPYAQAVDAGGQIVAGLAITQNNTNNFTTDCADYTIASISVTGFKTVSAYYGSNNQPHPTSAFASFLLTDPAVVVIFAIAGGEDHLNLQGVPDLQIDAQKPNDTHGIAIAIAHASLAPGRYTVTESTEGDPGRDPAHEGDLIGVFVFTGGSGVAAVSSGTVPVPTTFPSPPASGVASSTAAGNVTQAAAGVVTATVPGQAGPWDPVLNSSFDYGTHDQEPPVVISPANGVSFSPGTILTVKYVGGAVRAGGGWPQTDANGAVSHAAASNWQHRGNYPSRYIDTSVYPIYVASLVGTFAKDGVIVGTPFKIGNGPVTFTVPASANQLLLGVNDDRFSDNSGSWTVAVEVRESPNTMTYVATIAAAALIVAAAFAFMGWRRKRAYATGAAISRPATAAKPHPATQPAAATAAQSTPRPSEPPRPVSTEALDKLMKLKSLLDAGLITQEDFAREKAKLLGN